MINPIQQNVVFRGNNTNVADNFKGNAPRTVRGDYTSTVNNVLSIQQEETKDCNGGACGNNLNTIA